MSTACHDASAHAREVTVAVAVRGGGRSRRAVRWTAENLAPHAHRVLLLYVIPSISFIPSPPGMRIPIEHMEREVVDMYIKDRKLKSEEVFFQFKKLCNARNVETLVLDGENPAAALVRYAVKSGIKNLVLGSSSYNWIRRIFKGPDVPATVLKSAPSSCNIFVVSPRKVTIKFAVQGPNGTTETRTIGHKAFICREQFFLHGNQLSLTTLVDSPKSEMAALSDVETYSQTSKNSSSTAYCGFASEIASVYSEGHEEKNLALKGETPAEVVKLRLELQKTLGIYNKTCEELVRAKKKVELLLAECIDESKKVKDAMEREEVAKRIAEEEKAKHLKAIKEVQEARQLLAKEALDRHKAEIIASTMISAKTKLVDALFSNDKRYQRYSSKDIEHATDNFSDALKLGEGGYGCVYKCTLDHIPVAVKVLRQDRTDKKEEFLREVEVLSQLRHPNLVLLVGVCPEKWCLAYEYMENGSLEDQLFHREGKPPIPWYIRFRIIFEVACGLAFLHGTKPDPIVHRDLKPGNILLDRNFVSKIGDVGLAKLLSNVVPDGFTEYRETRLAGTMYYMDPEYHRTGTVRPKSDLYALGIIALQLLTAKHPKGLPMVVENAINDGSLAQILDKSISDWPLVEAEKLAKLALKCSSLRCRDRPDLETEVMPELEELLNVANVCFKLRQFNVYAPSHYICPILQEIMDNPYIAGDGFTYEYRAIKAWLEKHKISPVTKLSLTHTNVVPNYSLRAAIQEWKSRASFSSIT